MKLKDLLKVIRGNVFLRLINCGGLQLFFLGHMVWAYIWAVAFDGKRWGRLFIPAIFVFAVLPDFDLFLGGFGLRHHTFMHSLFFWFLLFMPFLVVYRGRVIPYFVAVVQHFAFGDFVVGDVMLLWPFSLSNFGFNNAIIPVLDVALETGGLLLAAGIMYFNGDLRRLLSVDKNNVWMFFPFLVLITSMMIFAFDAPIVPLVSDTNFRELFTIIVLAHVIFVGFLAVSTAQGSRRLHQNE